MVFTLLGKERWTQAYRTRRRFRLRLLDVLLPTYITRDKVQHPPPPPGWSSCLLTGRRGVEPKGMAPYDPVIAYKHRRWAPAIFIGGSNGRFSENVSTLSLVTMRKTLGFY